MNPDEARELKPGDIVHVRAWWREKFVQQAVRCRVLYLAPSGFDYLDVQPLEGNPHGRSVNFDAVLRRE